MKKIVSIIMVVLTVIGLFAGCSNTSKVKEVEITFLNNKTDINDTLLRDFADKFEEENPGIKVKLEAVSDYYRVAQTRAAGKALPDVSYLMNSLDKSEWEDFYVPIDDLDFGDFWFKDSYTYNGHLYAIPMQINYSCIVYNKKTFEKAGIKEVPKTIDELYDACEKLKAIGVVPTTPIYKESGSLGAYVENIAPCMDTEWINKMAEKENPFTIDSPVGKVLSMIDTMHKKGYFEEELMSQTSEGMKRDIAQGKLGFMISQTWLLPQVITAGAESADIGIFPIPFDNSGELKTLVRPDMRLAISKDSKHPEEAKKFLKWMMDTEYKYFLETMSGIISVKKDSDIYVMDQIKEFDEFNPEKITNPDSNEMWSKVANKAQISFDTMAHSVIDKNDVQAVLDEYNKIWNKAYEAVNK